MFGPVGIAVLALGGLVVIRWSVTEFKRDRDWWRLILVTAAVVGPVSVSLWRHAQRTDADYAPIAATVTFVCVAGVGVWVARALVKWF